MIFLKLFIEFFQVGLFAVGGGLATIPFLADLSKRTNWFSMAELNNMIAISESTPGAIGVNMSTYVGYEVCGVFGGMCATFGLVLPSIIVIIIISKILNKFRENKYVNFSFYGLRAASCALISAACFSIFKIAILDMDKFNETNVFLDLFHYKMVIYGAILAFFIFRYKKHPLFYIGISAIVGIVFQFSL